jgi:REP element-mobilizing transposase RayT
MRKAGLMPRQPRLEYQGAIYHIMSRGDQRDDIFLDDVDRHDFIKTLAEACQKTAWQVHALCLMRNHYHLVLETPNANLVAGMAWLQSTYTIRLNHRHQLVGHVLSGRCKAQLVEGSGNGYLRAACDYVHLNPIRARLLSAEDRLLAYPWSSFPLYLAADQYRPRWLRVDRLLGEHGIQKDSPAGRQEFERDMERRRLEEVDEAALKEFRRGWCIGSEAFRKECLEQMEGSLGENHPGQARQETAEAKADRIVEEQLRVLGWTQTDLAARPKSDPSKLATAARLRAETTLSLKQIAERLHLGKPKGAKTNLHKWMNRQQDDQVQPTLGI